MEGNFQICYQVFEKEQLLIQKFSGLFSFEIYSKYTSFLMQNSNLKNVSKVLIDFRELTIGNKLKEIKQEIKRIAELRKNIHQKEINRDAIIQLFIVDKPIPTAIAKIFINYFPHMDYRICSTTHSVISHLELELDETELEVMINSLKNEFVLQ